MVEEYVRLVVVLWLVMLLSRVGVLKVAGLNAVAGGVTLERAKLVRSAARERRTADILFGLLGTAGRLIYSQ